MVLEALGRRTVATDITQNQKDKDGQQLVQRQVSRSFNILRKESILKALAHFQKRRTSLLCSFFTFCPVQEKKGALINVIKN